jgi:hypothetical protein
MSTVANTRAGAHDPGWVTCTGCGVLFPAAPGQDWCRCCTEEIYDLEVGCRLVLPVAVLVPVRVRVRYLLRGRRRPGLVPVAQLALFPIVLDGGDEPCR